mgnify:CR=1 FL=1
MRVFKLFLRNSLAFILITAGLILLGSMVILVSFFEKEGRVAQWLFRLWVDIIIWTCGMKIRAEGMENIDPARSYIVVANHQSYMDIPALAYVFPSRLRFIAKSSLLYIPFFGITMKRLGHAIINRGERVKALKTVGEFIKNLRKGDSIVIFPEGTRSKDGRVGDFKKGALLLVVKSGLPVLPVAICGTRQVMPKGRFYVTPGEVRIKIGAPIDLANIKDLEKKPVRDRVIRAIKDDIRKKVESADLRNVACS